MLSRVWDLHCSLHRPPRGSRQTTHTVRMSSGDVAMMMMMIIGGELPGIYWGYWWMDIIGELVQPFLFHLPRVPLTVVFLSLFLSLRF